MWENEKTPQVLKKITARPIHKEEYRIDCNNYRGTALKDVTKFTY